MADSEYYYRAFNAYNDFLYSVFEEVKGVKRSMFESLSRDDQENVIKYLLYQYKGDISNDHENIVSPQRGSFGCDYIPKISEKEYLDFIDEYKVSIMEYSVRNKTEYLDDIKQRIVSKIIDLERIKLNKILGL